MGNASAADCLALEVPADMTASLTQRCECTSWLDELETVKEGMLAE